MITKARGSVYDLNYHLIWVTKYRKSVFVSEQSRKEMASILIESAKARNIIIQEMEVMPDHIHILYSAPPKESPSAVAKYLKGVSAIKYFKKHPELKELLWGGHLWTPSYFVSSLGNMSKDIVRNYIKSQLTEYNNGIKKKKRNSK